MVGCLNSKHFCCSNVFDTFIEFFVFSSGTNIRQLAEGKKLLFTFLVRFLIIQIQMEVN